MKKKVLFSTSNGFYLKGLAELFNFEADFGEVSRFNIYDDYNYNSIDLIIVDDDMDMISAIREKDYKKTLISLFSKDDGNLFNALEIGASDAMLKPVSYDSLITRIRASIYMEEHTFDGAMTFKNFIFMPKARTLRYIDKEIKLTEKEAGLINLLYKSRPEAVDRMSLLKEVWGYNAGVSTHTLETHIYRLRQKIEIITEDKFIITVDDGYTLS